MSTIEFDEQPGSSIHYQNIDISRAVTHNTPYLIKWGVVKDLQSANIVMIVLFVLLIIGSYWIYATRPSANDKKYKEDFTSAELNHMHPDMVNSLPSRSK